MSSDLFQAISELKDCQLMPNFRGTSFHLMIVVPYDAGTVPSIRKGEVVTAGDRPTLRLWTQLSKGKQNCRPEIGGNFSFVTIAYFPFFGKVCFVTTRNFGLTI